MTIKDIVFNQIENQFGNEGITKVIIKKEIKTNKTELLVSFKEDLNKQNETISLSKSESSKLNFLLMSKILRHIKKHLGKDIDIQYLYIYIKVNEKELLSAYQLNGDDKINMFNFN